MNDAAPQLTLNFPDLNRPFGFAFEHLEMRDASEWSLASVPISANGRPHV
jgi:hypothetical protein